MPAEPDHPQGVARPPPTMEADEQPVQKNPRLAAIVAHSLSGVRFFGQAFVFYFLEICAGTAKLSQAMRIAGWATLDPID